MKKIYYLLGIAALLCGCGTTNTTPTNTDTTPSTSVEDDEPAITTSTTFDSDSWDKLMPYLDFALEDYAQYVPAFSVHNYHLSYIVQDGTVAVQVNCLGLLSENAETTYSTILTNNDFQVVDNEPLYAYKMVSDVDCLYVSYVQDGSTFCIAAYYRQVRVREWPTDTANYVLGREMPVLEANAYYYNVRVNGRNYVEFDIDCFFNNNKESLNTYIKTLTKAKYEITNQNGYYTAISEDAEVIIQFNDYYGDGSCIEIYAYSTWFHSDYMLYFGMDLPYYEGENSGWESQMITITDADSYLCVYYTGVTEDCLSIYGNQLKKAGFTEDVEFVSATSDVYYLANTIAVTGEEPWVQIAYSAETKEMCIAVPYFYETEE